MHLIETKDDHIRCNNVSMPNIVKHTYKCYGKVTDADLLSNRETMSKHWNPNTPIQNIYKQVQDGLKFAKFAGLATQDKEKISIEY